MKSDTLPDIIAGGIDQRTHPSQHKAKVINNFRYHEDGGWRNDRGWEPLIPYSAPIVLTPAQLTDISSPCRFLSVWTRHAGSEEYVLQERSGNLFYEFGNQGTAASRTVTLDTGRHLPRSDEAGTQLVPFGRFALLMNGHDEMLKFWGRSKVETFGFTQAHPSPLILDVTTDWNQQNGVPPQDVAPFDSDTNNDLSGIAIQFLASSYLGLGDPDKGSVNSYSWRVSYVSDTGSEGPLSEPASVTWELPTDASHGAPIANANARKYGVIVSGLSPGPNGTVARNIYRTKNKRDGLSGAGDIYYFVARINDNTCTTYTDITPDNNLVNEAPTLADSVPISNSYKYGAAWNGSMWLGGGDVLPTQLRFSKAGFPEQFGAFDTFDVGVREGGAITALFPYYNTLLIFRENSIDAVFVENGAGTYNCSTIHQTIGTIATESIKLVPGVGVIFLNKNGFYLLSGGFQGGSSFEVKNVSAQINTELSRVSSNALARSSASYSDKEKEYWCHFPVDGNTENTHGASFNTLTNEWSFRGNTTGLTQNEWRFTKIATDNSGWFLLGTAPLNTLQLFPGIGVQVWSARRSYGDSLIPVLLQETYTITPTPHGLDNSIWQSTWNDFGDDSVKKRVLSIELETLTEGDGTVELQWASDFSTDWNSAGTVPRQIGDNAFSSVTDPTFNAAAAAGSNIAVWDVSKWQPHKVTRMRWDVNTGLVSHFSFRVITTNIIQVVKYQINFIVGSVKTPSTRMPGATT